MRRRPEKLFIDKIRILMKLIKNLLYTLFIFILFHPLANARSQTPEHLLMLGGEYGDKQVGAQPLLITSADAGLTWKKAALPPFLPNTIGYKQLADMTCHNSYCIAAANANASSDGTTKTQLFTSFDNGITWQNATIIHNKVSTESQSIDSISCNDDYCMVIGNDGETLLSYASYNKGVTWIQIPPPENIAVKYGAKVYCFHGMCNAVGGLYDTLKDKMVTLTSVDGASWEAFSNINGVPNGSSFIDNVGLYCFDVNCVAAGNTSSIKPGAMFIYSRDGGINWQAIHTVSSVDLSNSVRLGRMFCDGDKCVAVGIALNQPIIFISQNKGMSWYKAPILNATPIKGFGILFDVACHDNVCIAAGNENMSTPYIAKSVDYGMTWNRITKISNLPEKYFLLSSQSITCQDQSCFIGGYYAKTSSNIFQADIISSTDNGDSWTVNMKLNKSLFNAKTDSALYLSNNTDASRNNDALLKKKLLR